MFSRQTFSVFISRLLTLFLILNRPLIFIFLYFFLTTSETSFSVPTCYSSSYPSSMSLKISNWTSLINIFSMTPHSIQMIYGPSLKCNTVVLNASPTVTINVKWKNFSSPLRQNLCYLSVWTFLELSSRPGTSEPIDSRRSTFVDVLDGS